MTNQPTSNPCKGPARLQAIVLIALLFFTAMAASAQTGTSTWVRIGTNGKLQYTPDAKGNTIPDFSMVGYQFGNEAIPAVPVVKTLTALTGDNLSAIQAAINEVAARTPDANGFRGAILLKKGAYNVSNTLNITASGVVLRGEGAGTADTRLIATRTAQHTLVNIIGGGSPAEVSGTRQKITNSYVPAGAKTFTVQSAAGFAAGDEVILRVQPKEAWITLLDMAQYGWTPSAYNMSYVRTITHVDGNTVTIDAPVVDPLDITYKDAYIYKYTWNKIEKVGVENIRFSSVYTGTDDENHGWTAISIDRARHSWVRNCNFYYWGYSAVFVKEWGVNISVLNCQNRDPISQTTGGRKYSFNLNGQLTLMKDNYTHSGRHDYVTGSTTGGPNAFVNCRADNQRADIGPHHRWATGLLFDNVTGSGDQNVQNRQESGSGHGWAGAQTLFWNCTSPKFIVQKPPQHLNWAIGCKGNVTDNGNWHDGDPGIWESTGNFVPPQSIYEQQLQDRLTGSPSCEPVTANADDGNVPANVLDGNPGTRWSANGDGQWIQFCLNTQQTVSGVKIAFYNGNTRTSTFDVLIGNDGVNWSTLGAGIVSSGTTLNLESFNFSLTPGKYVRIVGHGNSVNLWNSYTEVVIMTTTNSNTYTMFPLHDAYVRDGANAGITHGITDSTTLITKVSPAGQLNNNRESYLQFDLSAVAGITGSITRITFNAFGKVDGTSVPTVSASLFPVANTTWTESAITWNNKPAAGTTALGTGTVNNTAYSLVTYDITSYALAELGAARPKMSFVMRSDVAHDPRVFWGSDESASFRPFISVETTDPALTARPAAQVQSLDKTAEAALVFKVYPNPFSVNSTISFRLEKAGQTNLRVFDISGKRVAVLVNGYLSAGNHRATFTPGTRPAGIYILKLEHNGKTVIGRVMKN